MIFIRHYTSEIEVQLMFVLSFFISQMEEHSYET